MPIIDNNVVSMSFDNSKFEKNVNQSILSLSKLKEALTFDGLKNSLSSLGKATETVKVKFSAMQVAAVAALTRMSNAAITAGKNMVKSLSTDQISAGWDKYAQKTTGVQTIMAATGKSIDKVSESLEKLNWFTDETSYSFTDMVTNIGKFTSQGIDLDTAVSAMEGISNWAAVSGQGVNEASRAMYNLAQAIGVGSVKLMDWKSIENANMGTKEFKEQAIAAAVAAGTLGTKVSNTGETLYYAMDKAGKKMTKTQVTIENFSQTLSEGWFTSDVLVDVLKDYGSYADGLYEISDYVQDGISKTTSEIIEDLDKITDATTDADIIQMGYTEDAIEKIRELAGTESVVAKKSFKAAQEAKTFAEAISSVKDAVSTGWMTTFENIFGNYEEAKKLWTDLANDLYEVFAESGNERNEILAEWKGLVEGGREDLIASMKSIFTYVTGVWSTVKEVFHEIFPKKTAKDLGDLVKRLKSWTEGLGTNTKRIEKFKNTLHGLFLTFRTIRNIILQVKSGITSVFGNAVGKTADAVFTIFSKIGDALAGIYSYINKPIYEIKGKAIMRITEGLAKVVKSLWSKLKDLASAGKTILSTILGDKVIGKLKKVTTSTSLIDKAIVILVKGLNALSEKIDSLDIESRTTKIIERITKIKTLLAPVFELVKDFIGIIAGTGDVDSLASKWLELGGTFGKVAESLMYLGYNINAVYWRFVMDEHKGETLIKSLANVFSMLFSLFINSSDAAKKSFQNLIAKAKELAKVVDDKMFEWFGEYWINLKGNVNKVISVINRVYTSFENLAKAVKKAYAQVFPLKKSVTSLGDVLLKIKDKVVAFVKSLEITDKKAAVLTRVFRGLFAAADLIITAFRKIGQRIKRNEGFVTSFISKVADLIVRISDLVYWFDRFVKTGGKIDKLGILPRFRSIEKVIRVVADSFANFGKAIKDAYLAVFPFKKTSIDLGGIITKIKDKIIGFIKSLEITDEKVSVLTRLFRGLFAVVDVVLQVFKAIGKQFKENSKNTGSFAQKILDLILRIADWLYYFDKFVKEESTIDRVVSNLVKIFSELWRIFKQVGSIIKQVVMGFLGIEEVTESESAKKAADGFASIADALEWIADKLSEVDFEEIIGKARGFGEKMREVFDGIKQGAKDTIAKVKDFITGLKNGISGGLTLSFLNNDDEDGFFEKRELKTTFFDDLVEKFNLFKEKVGPGVVELLNKLMESLQDPKTWKTIFEIMLLIASGKFVKSLTEVGYAASETLYKIGNVLGNFGGDSHALKAIKAVSKSILMIAASLFILAKIDTVKVLEGVGVIAALMAILQNSFTSLKGVKNALWTTTLSAIAKAMILFAISMKVMSSVDVGGIIKSLISMAVIFKLIENLYTEFAKAKFTKNSKEISKVIGSIIKLAIAMIIFGAAMKIISSISVGGLAKSVITMALILELVKNLYNSFSKAKISDNSKAISKTVGSIIKLAIAMVIFAAAMKIIASIDVIGLIKSVVVVALLFELIKNLYSEFGKAKLSNNSKSISKLSGAMIKTAAAIVVFAAAMKIISSISLVDMAASVAVIGILLTLIVDLYKEFSKSKVANNAKTIQKLVGAMIEVAVAMVIFAAAMKIIASIDAGGIVKSLITIAAFMLMMKILENVKSDGILKVAGAMIMVSAALVIFSVALAALTLITQNENVIGAVIVIMLFFAALVIINQVSAGLPIAAAGMLLVSAALLILGVALIAIAAAIKMFIEIISTAPDAFHTSLSGIVNLVLMLIPEIAVALITGFVLIITTLADNAPILMESLKTIFLSIMTVLIEVIVEIAPRLLELIGTLLIGVLDLLITISPKILELVGILIVGILDTLTKSIPSFVAFIEALVEAIVELVPFIVNSLFDMLISIVRLLGKRLPDLIDAFFGLVYDLITGVTNALINNAEKIGEAIAYALGGLIVAALKTLKGLITGASNIGVQIKEAASELGSALMEKVFGGLMDIKESADKAIEKVKEVGSGIANGIKDSASTALNGVKSFGTNVIDGLKDVFGTHSPSTETEKIGGYLDEGLEVGIADKMNSVVNAAKGLGSNVLIGLTETLSNAQDAADINFEFTPTITPVMDLSEFTAGIGDMNSMLNGLDTSSTASIDLTGAATSSNLSSISSLMSTSGLGQNGISESDTSASAGTTINLTQNNYSPEALSRTDIYRQTKNLLSTMQQAWGTVD